mgnify:CR=1 FL=1
MCGSNGEPGGHSACCTAHNPYSLPSTHPTYYTVRATLRFLHPAATPSAVRAARHATPLGGDSYYFHFSNSVWGAGNVQHPPLCSLYTPPARLSTTHEGFSVSVGSRRSSASLLHFSLGVSVSPQVASQRKNIYIYLFLRGIYACPLQPSSPPRLASLLAVPSISFSFFRHSTSTLRVSRSLPPLSPSPRYLSVSPPVPPSSVSLPRFLSSFLVAFSLPPPQPPSFATARCGGRETDTRIGASERVG